MVLFTGAFVVLLLAFPSRSLSESGIRCYSPVGDEGICISANQCPAVIDILKKYKGRLPHRIHHQIRELACDGEKGARYPICCPTVSMPNVGGEVLEQPKNLSYIDPKGMEILEAVTDCGERTENLGSRVLVGNGELTLKEQRIEDIESRVLVSHGELTRKEEFPWMALLKYETSGRPFLCGGSLITDRFVLTAAHCITASANIIAVRMGEHNLGIENDCLTDTDCLPSYEEFGVEDIRRHPKYERHTNSYDIALIKLNRSVTFRPNIRPICLPIESKSQNINDDQNFYIAGWGKTEKRMPSPILLKALVVRQHLDVCRKYYKTGTFTENHICAMGNKKQETCQGDSGGPLFFRYYFKTTTRFVQYGVVSFGGQSCGINENQPGVFASVLDMLPWITQNLY
ncbi:serine protease grass-like isoform X1 [Drosophila albomicans]|uniref:CLIP domain-containing serine protease n=1 Tax=Drosophila albomicans TaxID=7291 RepID=A0A9C6TAZ7_DROAB|nr:serine protease grass-like isoform X1 [Drosophila albomicans]